MLWSFIAVCFSAWLYVDASYRGPVWQRWVFKPVTLLLLLLLAWQAPMFEALGYLVVAGLLATLVGDTLTLLPRERLLYAIGAFFLSHLLYTIYFASQMTLSFYWPLPLALVVIGVALIAVIWTRRRAALADLHFYRHDAGDGVARGRIVVLPPNRHQPVGICRRSAAAVKQHSLAG